VAIDPKHLPEDPKTLQQMVLDLMAQLDREFTERNKIEGLLRELLDANAHAKVSSSRRIHWRCSQPPGKRGRRKQARMLKVRMTMTTSSLAGVARLVIRKRRPAVAGSPRPSTSSESGSCTI